MAGLPGLIVTYRHRFPDLRIVHYSAFKVTQINAYARRFAMEYHPTFAWLLGDCLRTREPAERAEIRREIETYNQDDVLATRALEVWLREFAAPDNSHYSGFAA